MPVAVRRSLALLLALVLLAVEVPTILPVLAGPPPWQGTALRPAPARRRLTLPARYPTLVHGNRGSNVLALQRLIDLHSPAVTTHGRFTFRLRNWVRRFQRQAGLRPTGHVSAATWKALLTPIRRGDRGAAVRAAEELLRAKMRARITVDGVFGRRTVRAVRSLQGQRGAPVTGMIGRPTWKLLLSQLEEPNFGRRAICDYDVPKANWGSSTVIGAIELAARLFRERTGGRLAVGDVSLRRGGRIEGHVTHRLGLDVDIRPARRDRKTCTYGVNWRSKDYSRPATRQLIKAIKAAAGPSLKHVAFNDPVFLREGLTIRAPDHHDHLHDRFC
jgi:peptidoglycan hydrolase-like protein with peptidoglycan-binding domain